MDGTTPLAALTDALVSITMSPRIVTNSRNVVAGPNQGVEGIPLVVDIASGPGPASPGGFIHNLGYTITDIKVLTVNNATVSGLGTWQSCAAGICSVTIDSLTGGSFVSNASFTYDVRDGDGYTSHVAGNSSVYFYPRPQTGINLYGTVAADSTNNTLTISSGSGYTHSLSQLATSWDRPVVPSYTLNGSLSGWSCTGAGVCTVSYTPTPGFFTADSSTASNTKFDYRVAINSASGTIWSGSPDGIWNIDVFPKPVPVSLTKELHWVKDIGDTTATAGQKMRITVRKGIDYTHGRNSDPVKILTSNIVGGSFSGSFVCSGDSCYADFIPTAGLVSANPTTSVSSFKLQIVAENAVKYLPYPSDPITYSIIVMPPPTANAFTINTVQGRTQPFKMGATANGGVNPIIYDALDHAWNSELVSPSDIEITSQPTSGTVSIVSCTAGVCLAEFKPTLLQTTGTSTFQYKVTARDPSDPTRFVATSAPATGTIVQVYEHTVTGQSFSLLQLLDGSSNIIPVTVVPLTISLGNGYNQVEGQPTLEDLQIMSTLPASVGTITGASVTNGVWTANFNSANYWFGTVNLNYRVCRKLGLSGGGCLISDDVKSLPSPSGAEKLSITVIPNNNAPVACNKNLIVYQNINKSVTMVRDNGSCGNGKWYSDSENDDVSEIKFLNVSNTTTWGVFSGISVGNGGDGTTCTISGNDAICTCATNSCTWQWTPPAGLVNTTRVVNWKLSTFIPVLNAAFESTSSGQITFDIKPPLAPITNSFTLPTRNVDTAFALDLDVGSAYKTVPEINAGYAVAPDGYEMLATQVQVVSISGSPLNTVTSGACNASGKCILNVTPLTDGSGVATINYRLMANGVWSNTSVATVKIYVKPRPTSASAVVLKDSSNNTLTVSPGLGYNATATAAFWDRPTTPVITPNGTLSGWSCNGSGSCTVSFTPTAGWYSSDSTTTNATKFDYRVAINTDTVPLWSDPPDGTFNIDVFPKPVIVTSTKELHWAQYVGDVTAPAGQKQRITIKKTTDYTHDRGSDPVKILPTAITGGTFSGPFTCLGDSCYADFIPDAGVSSATPTTVAASFQLQIVVENNVKYLPFPSDPITYNIIIMPAPTAKAFTINTVQGRTQAFKMGPTANGGASPIVYDAFDHVWSNPAFLAASDIQITSQSANGTITVSSCTAGDCLAQFAPTLLQSAGTTTFNYTVTVTDPNDPTHFVATSLAATGTIVQVYEHVVNGRTFNQTQVLDGGGHVIPGTVVPLSISLNNGYTQVENNATLEDLQITTSIPGSVGTITGESVSGGVWTANFNAANLWYGTLNLNYRVCRKLGASGGGCLVADDVKSLASPTSAEQIRINVLPGDTPPVACNKTIIVYQDTVKFVKTNRNNGSCGNGDWYADVNNDYVSQIKFLNVSNTATYGTFAGVTSGQGGDNTTCSIVGNDAVCTCASNACHWKWTPPAGAVNTTRSISYKLSTYSTDLSASFESTAAANLTFDIKPPLAPVATNFSLSRSDDVVFSIPIDVGSAYQSPTQINSGYGLAPDGYDMIATQVQVVSFSGTPLGTVTAGTCTSAGICQINVTPLTTTSGSATINYKVLANGIWSNTGVTTVHIYIKPSATSASAVVLKDSSNNSLSISKGSGYLSSTGSLASLWQRPGAPTLTPEGTLNSWSCDVAGVCTVSFTPTPGWYSSDATIATATKFDYQVAINTNTVPLWSDPPDGTFNIDVFPKPIIVSSTKTLYWVEGVGDVTKSAGQKQRITIKKGDDYGHLRNSDPVKILVSAVTGGTFSGQFSCIADTCTADFIPTVGLSSANNTAVAASFAAQIVVGDAVKYLPFPSDPITHHIIIMPAPTAKAFTINAVQGRTQSFKMGPTANGGANPIVYDAFDHAWNGTLSTTSDIQITSQSANGPITIQSCSGGDCLAQFVPTLLGSVGSTAFTYTITVRDASNPTQFVATSTAATATINQVYEHTVTGKTFSQAQALDGSLNLIPVTVIPLSISLGSGYTQVDNAATLEDLQITSSLSGAIGTITGAAVNSGVWTANFNSASYWFGNVKLNYRVCRKLGASGGGCLVADDVKSLPSPATPQQLSITVVPNNNPPVACNKTIIVYQNTTKFVTMARDNASCGNGKWYSDLENDQVSQIKFLSVSNTATWGTFAGVSVGSGGDGTTCSIVSTDVVCNCATPACTWKWTPPVGEVNITKAISWKLSSYITSLAMSYESDSAGTITFDLKPPLAPISNALSTTKYSSAAFSLAVDPGTGYQTASQINASYGVAPDGYDMLATQIQVVSNSGSPINTATAGTCNAAGNCLINVTPLAGISGTATINFRVMANGIWSNTSVATVQIFAKPVPTSANIIVAKDSTNNPLTINQGSGYTSNIAASLWQRPGTPAYTPSGTLSGWSCSGTGACTVNFTPTAGYYSTSSSNGNATKFDYQVAINTDTVPLWSAAPDGVFYIDVFPKPEVVSATQTLHWVKDIGDITASTGQKQRITIEKNVDYTHQRNSNPVKVLVSAVSGGTFSGAFTCSSTKCNADFVPTAGLTSATNATVVASFQLQVVVEDDVKYLSYPTDPITYNIIIMPPPTAKAFTINTLQGRTQTFKMGLTGDAGVSPIIYDALDHPWNAVPTATADIDITTQSANGTVSVISCSGGDCLLQFEPTLLSTTGTTTFTYTITARDPSDPTHFAAVSPAATVTIVQDYEFAVTGATFNGFTASGVPVTVVPLTISLNNGYTQAENFATLQDLKITSTLSGSIGTITDVVVSGGTWTANFNSASNWYGTVNLNYQVCRKLGSSGGGCSISNEVKSLPSPGAPQQMVITITPTTIAPEACDKTLNVFTNTAKTVTMVRDNASCGNGKWYVDVDGDNISKIKFLNVSNTATYGTFAGITSANGGDNTTCSIVAADVECTCVTSACTWSWTPPVGTTNTTIPVSYIVSTYSTIFAVTGNSSPKTLSFTITPPLAPVGENLTINTSEDTTYNLTIQPGYGYLTPSGINASYISLPDGYPMTATAVSIVSFDTNAFVSVTPGACNAGGQCPVAIVPLMDFNGTGTFVYMVTANGLLSPSKTITVNFAAVEDAPQVAGINNQTMVFNRKYEFDATANPAHYGTFYLSGSGQPITVTLSPYTNPTYNNSPWRAGINALPTDPNRWTKGYYDVDSGLATKVRIVSGSLAGGTIDYAAGKDANDAFTCDGAGVCTASFVPNGSKLDDFMTVRYYVTTSQGPSTPQEQPLYSTLDVYVSGGPTAPTSSHLPVPGTQDPSVSPPSFDVNYTVGRGTTTPIPIPATTWTTNQFLNFAGSGNVTSIEIGNGSNGASAPTNLAYNSGTDPATCDATRCTVPVITDPSYASYPATGSFWYRIKTGENYTAANGYAFGNNLAKSSNWSKVTVKILLAPPGLSCPTSGVITNNALLGNVVQGGTFSATIGNGGTNGNFYTYPSAETFQQLVTMLISDTDGSSITGCPGLNCTCSSGRCDFSWKLPGNTTPTDFNDDAFETSWITVTGYDTNNCNTNTTNLRLRIIPKIATRSMCPASTYAIPNDDRCIQAVNTINIINRTPTTITFRKQGALAATDQNGYEYSSDGQANAAKIRIFGFNSEVATILKAPLTSAFSGSGVTCTGSTPADLVCETTNCDASGTCSIDMQGSTGSDWGLVQFSYNAYLADGTVSQTYQHNWQKGTPNGATWLPTDGMNYVTGNGLRKMWVKAMPTVTNPTVSTSMNEAVTIVIGREDLGFSGINYPDSANWTGQNVTISTFNLQNLSIGSSTYDPTNKTLTVSVIPNLNFEGNGTFNYNVTVWGITSATGTYTVSANRDLIASSATRSTNVNTVLNGSVTKNIDYVKKVGVVEDDAVDLQILNSDYTAVPAGKGSVTIGTCTTGTCTFTYTPPTAVFTGTVALKYRVKGGPVGNRTWSNYADFTIDVLALPTPPVVYNLSFTGSDETMKLLSISPGIANGYTDVNNDLAAKLFASNPTNGTLSPANPITCDGTGMCLVSFMPNAGHYGSATFDFNVEANGQQATTGATVTVDFQPQLRAQNLTVNGVMNQNKSVTISRNNGYTYNPGPNVNKLIINSITNGSISGNPTEITCTAGSCPFTFIPTPAFTGNATVGFKARINGTPDQDSNNATLTIAISATDAAPVANNFAVILPNRSAYVVELNPGTQYTDLESDKASTMTIMSAVGGSGSAESCNGTTGVCNFTYTPSANYFGEGRVLYTVTANGKTSNQGVITFTIPDDATRSFTLGWGASPVLDGQCKITIPGVVSVLSGGSSCGSDNCVTPATGTIATSVSTLGVTANLVGVNGTLNVFTNLTKHQTTWEVTNGAETARIARYLELKDLGAPTQLRIPILSLTPTFDMVMEGIQTPFQGCSGASCGTTKPASLTSGDDFNCALTSDARVSCWGSNSNGKLGRNETSATTPSSWEPMGIRDPNDPDFDLYSLTAVVAGKNHGCALNATKRVVCWGSNEFGQLGANLATGVGETSVTPVFVKNTANSGNLSNIVALAAGNDHTCAIDTSRKTYCWGKNANGQLGNGTTTLAAIPVAVKLVTAKDGSDNVTATADLSDVFSISAGESHTCAVRLTVVSGSITGQNVLCWGANDSDQIGDNDYWSNDASLITRLTNGDSNLDRVYPVLVRDASNVAIANLVSVSAGGKTSCVLLQNQKAMCWGSNTQGVAGVDTPATNTKIKNPTTVRAASGASDLTNIVSITVGNAHACALLNTKEPVCWGANSTYQLGNGTSTDSVLPVTIKNTNDSNVSGVYTVQAGFNHTCITDSSGVRCFGSNGSSQIGVSAVGTEQITVGDPVHVLSGSFDTALKACTKVYDFVVP